MTANQLLGAVYALGFESSGEADDAFIISANRALREIAAERGIVRSVEIPVRSVRHTELIRVIRHAPGEERSIRLEGYSLSFILSGRGTYVLEYEGERAEREFDGNKIPVKHRVLPGTTLTFTGELSYTVFNLASFEERYDKDEQIPLYSPSGVYTIRDFAPDFLHAEGPAVTCEGEKINGAVISGGTLYTPHGYDGVVRISYAAAPREIDLDNLDEELDVLPECEHLLSLLVASYVWLDDDGDRAQYYMSLYKDGLARIKRYNNFSLGDTYQDVLGWA